uniref:Uncharacterized protein n=1 Tax=Anguilla anguilla TaxID=7936 RepID=A0A0E9TAM2_ANGAN
MSDLWSNWRSFQVRWCCRHAAECQREGKERKCALDACGKQSCEVEKNCQLAK